nr:MAG TPA: hypothetical protein [Caudoviricetes sp.]
MPVTGNIIRYHQCIIYIQHNIWCICVICGMSQIFARLLHVLGNP